VELAGAGLALALWHWFPGSPLLWVYAPFGALLVVLTVLDLEHRWLPDILTLPGIVLGLGLSLYFPHLTFLDALAGALAGWVLFLLLAWVYERLTGKRGMGDGDVKLLALIGAFLGIRALPWVILISATLGSLAGLTLALWGGRWRRGQWRHVSLPYGPFLAAAALLYLLVDVDFFI
jgi:leader peptidase (prepilin peptidase)/N-methyltransferase